jgi:hypothetical protein
MKNLLPRYGSCLPHSCEGLTLLRLAKAGQFMAISLPAACRLFGTGAPAWPAGA